MSNLDTEKREAITIEIQALYDQYRQFLGDGAYLWESEREAWNQLVFRVLTEISQDAAAAGDAVAILDRRNLLQITTLAGTEKTGKEVKAILRAAGFEEEVLEKGLKALSQMARFFQEKYSNSVLKFLRRHGQAMVDEVSQYTGSSTTLAVTSWIQSISNMPVIPEYECMEYFCEKWGCTLPELVDIADDMGINTVVLSDLLMVAWSAELE